MKRKKQIRPKYKRSILFFCYLAGVFDRCFKCNKGDVKDAAFIAGRIAAFTDYTAKMMKTLEDATEKSRSEAQIIISSLDNTEPPDGKSMGQKRARKLLEERKAAVITLDSSIRRETFKAKESILSYVDKLKAQTTAYAHGLTKRTAADPQLNALYSIEQNSAFIAYRNTNAVTDSAIHLKANEIAGITEKGEE